MGFRLAILVAGMMLASGRRTASSWFAAAGVRDDWDRFYDCLGSVGRCFKKLSAVVLGCVLKTVFTITGAGTQRVLLAIDDTPTARYWRHVEGAGVHHDPTPGPAGSEFLYGNNWVTLALLAAHPLWGVIALPLMSLLYVRRINVPKLAATYSWVFRTKHHLAVELVEWFLKTIDSLELTRQVWVVVDGAYAARPFIIPLCQKGVTLFSRLRRDAVLSDLPPKRPPGTRGRPAIYGERLSLAKRAAHRGGWEKLTYLCRGREVTRQVKSFTAMSKLTGGLIRVVIVRFEDGRWAPYFCTDAAVSVREILEAVASRWALEEHFHDIKEVWGAGQQQVRNLWSNIGCWHLNQWLFTLVEICSWDREKTALTKPSRSPLGPRRPPPLARRPPTLHRTGNAAKPISHTCPLHLRFD